MNNETKDLLKAWAAISLAFAIVLSGGLSFSAAFITMFIISGLTVGLGFLLHEFAHRALARRYNCRAEFRSFDQMLILAILMSFLGFILAAPGAVFISGHISREQNGKISAAGPATNIVLALIFFLLMFLGLPGILGMIFSYGKMINGWLALFNMIPFGNFDGAKILRWNSAVYGIKAIAAVALVFVV